ncbi:tail length tape measure protein [Hafnia phage yong3]|nr:tail length tape measure protein [Hafnia phage yong3]
MAESASLVIKVATAGINTAEVQLRRLATSGLNAQSATTRLASGFSNLNRQANELSRVTDRLDAAFIGLISTATVQKVIELSDTWTVLSNKLELARIGNERVADAQQRVFEVAQRTRTDLSATATLYSRLERAMRQTGVTGNELGRITETINKAMIISGATSSEASAALIQFSQAMASGVLRGDEFRSVAEQAPRLTQILTESLGVTIGGLREMAYSGKLSSDIVIDAIKKAANTIDTEFGRTMPTFSQQWTLATNNLTKFAGESEKSRGAITVLGQGIVTLSENLDALATVAGVVATIITARVVTAMGVKAKASISAAAAEKLHSAQLSQTNAVMQSSVGVSAAKAQADRAASLASLQVARASLQVAKGTAAEAGARLALIHATRQHSAAVVADTQARLALNAALNATVPAATRAAGALRLASGALALIGGPLGLAMLAAGAIAMFAQSQNAAVAEAKDFAENIKYVTDNLKDMTQAQIDANAARARAAVPILEEQMNKDKRTVEQLTQSLRLNEQMQAESGKTEQQLANLKNAHAAITDKLIIATEAAEKSQKQYTETLKLADPVVQNLSVKVSNLAADLRAISTIKVGINIDSKVIDNLAGDVQGLNQTLEINKLKAAGAGKQAEVLKTVMTSLGKDYATHETLVKKVISGQVTSTTATDENTKAFAAQIEKMVALAGSNYDLEQGMRASKAATKESTKDNKQNAKVIQELHERLEEATIGVEQNARAKAIAVATNKLNASATAAEVEEVKKLAAALYEQEQAAKKVEEQKKARAVFQKFSGEGLTNFEAIEHEKNAKLAEINKAWQTADLNDYKLYEDAKTAILTEAQLARENLQMVLMNRMISFNSDSLGIMLNAMKDANAESNFLYKALFAAQQAMQIPSIIASAETASAAALAWGTSMGGPALGATMAGVTKALGYASAATVAGLSLAGMAHDGIDEVPTEGTWLLQKGERVLNAPSNDKLNRFLDSGGNMGNAGANTRGSVTIIQKITIQGAGDAALTQALQKAARDGAEQGYNKVLADFAGRGTIRRNALG